MSSSLVYRLSSIGALEPVRGSIGLLLLLLSYGYSSWMLGLFNNLSVTLLASPAQSIAVALLGLCLFPQARARLTMGSNSNSECSSKSATDKESAAGASTDGAARRRSLDGSCIQSFKLSQPPFAADLSCGLSPNYNCSSSSKGRRRRFPRVSIELTPLPRLSLDFQGGSSSSRRRLSTSSLASLDGCSPFSDAQLSFSCCSSSSRWQPSMSRIRSGHDLQHMRQEAEGSGFSGGMEQLWASANSSGSLQDASTAGEATESLGHSVLAPGLDQVAEVVNETHLLQVGAMLGEVSSRAALVAQEAGGPVGHPSSFYGSADTDDFLEPWDLLLSESNSHVLYWAWRRPLRKGLYMYMTRSVFLDASPAELRAFMNDDAYRVVWDNAMTMLRSMLCGSDNAATGRGSSSSGSNAAVEAMAAAVAARTAQAACSMPSSGTPAAAAAGAAASFEAAAGSMSEGGSSSTASASPFADAAVATSSSVEVLGHEQAVMQALVQFPKPMASRSYIYARRVWHRPSDGGCYCLSKSCSHPNPLPLPCRAVAVEDYVSGCVIRAPAPQLLPSGYSGPAAEVFMVYFEDSHVRPGLANLGIKKGLWPLVLRTEKALRVYQAGAAANMHLQQGADAGAGAAAGSCCQLRSSKSSPAGSPGISRQASLQWQESLQGCAAAAAAAAAAAGSASVPCSPAKAAGEFESSSNNADDCEGAVLPGAGVLESTAQGSSSSAQCTASHTPDADVVAASTSCDSSDSFSKPGNTCSTSKLAASSSSSSWWSWSHIAHTVGNALKGSGQLLAAASVALWRSHTRLALMVPTLEWRLLHWLLQHISAPTQLLLGAPHAAAGSNDAAAGSSRGPGCKLQAVSSHPIGDWFHPGQLQRLKKESSAPSLLRVTSHPLTAEELQAAADSDSPPAGPSRLCSSNGRELAQLHFGQCGSSGCCCFSEGAAAQQLLQPSRCGACGAAVVAAASSCSGSSSEVCAVSSELLQLHCSREPLLGCDWPSAGCSTSSMHSSAACCHHYQQQQQQQQQHLHSVPGSATASAAGDDSSWSRCGSISSVCCSCCCHQHAGGASASVSESGRSCGGSSSRCGGRSSVCSGSRVSGGGRRQRRVVVRLMQAAGVRLAHKLLSAMEQQQQQLVE